MWEEKAEYNRMTQKVQDSQESWKSWWYMWATTIPPFTSLHFNFSSQEESGLYPFSSMNGCRDLSAQLRAHIHKISSTQVLFPPLPPLWFLSFKKKRDKQVRFLQMEPKLSNCFVCLVWRSSELLNLTLTFLRVSFTHFIIRRSRL
jgi:hypothetical protein